jgi:DNA ligase-1
MIIKPQLADNYDPDNISLPTMAQPKIDGVRALNIEGKFMGRQLKAFKNKALTERFSGPEFEGFDGELAFGDETLPRLCSITTGETGRIKGTADGFTWHVFDLVTFDTAHLEYVTRYTLLGQKVAALGHPQIKLVPYRTLAWAEEVEAFDAENLGAGYEGTILRNPRSAHKPGRPGKKEQQLMRIKRFTDAEAVVLEVVEGRTNLNEAVTNALGRTERSSHAENQVPNGLVGSLTCRDLETGMTITVSPGEMDHTERRFYFENQSEIVGKTITYKSFRQGVKVLPRFPTFKHIRSSEDMDAK